MGHSFYIYIYIYIPQVGVAGCAMIYKCVIMQVSYCGLNQLVRSIRWVILFDDAVKLTYMHQMNDPRSVLLFSLWDSCFGETLTKSNGCCSWSSTKTSAVLLEFSCVTVTEEAVANSTWVQYNSNRALHVACVDICSGWHSVLGSTTKSAIATRHSMWWWMCSVQ